MTVTRQDETVSKAKANTKVRSHKFIFVGGSARSGTTLIQKMLCAHSEVCGGPEFDHAVPAMQLFARMTSAVQLDRQKFFYSEEEVTQCFREFYASLFDGLAARNPGVRYISEKTPANIAAAANLLRLFPDAIYVNVVRDGRDVVLSHQKVLKRFKHQHGKKGRRWWHEYSVREVSRRWNADISRYEEIARTKSVAKRVVNMKYEDVVAEPESVVGELFRKLGLSLEAAVLQPELLDAETGGFSASVDEVWYTSKQFNQKLNSGSVGTWRKNLPWTQRVLANLMQCRNLQRMGYPVSPSVLRLRNIIDRLRGRPIN